MTKVYLTRGIGTCSHVIFISSQLPYLEPGDINEEGIPSCWYVRPTVFSVCYTETEKRVLGPMAEGQYIVLVEEVLDD